MKNKKTELFSTFRYVLPAEYEAWFEDLAMMGWHPKPIRQFSSFAMTFERGAPKRYRYVVDLQPFYDSHYQPTYESFG